MEKSGRDWKAERKANLPLLLLQVALALILMFFILYGGYYHLHCYIPVPESNDFSAKLIYALRTCGFPGVMVLLAAVQMTSNKRGTTDAYDPLSGNEHLLQIEKGFLANTVEQLLLFFLFVLVLITYLHASEMRIVTLYSIIFVVSRILFRIGYGIDPGKYRGLGISMIFFTNFFIVGLTVYLMYTRGFMYNQPTTTSLGDALASEGKTEL